MPVYANGEHDPAFARGPEESVNRFSVSSSMIVNRTLFNLDMTYSAALVTL